MLCYIFAQTHCFKRVQINSTEFSYVLKCKSPTTVWPLDVTMLQTRMILCFCSSPWNLIVLMVETKHILYPYHLTYKEQASLLALLGTCTEKQVKNEEQI